MALKFSKQGKLSSPGPLSFPPGEVTPGKELGRISGPLLADNLLRKGVNLAFDTDLMYLNVNSKYIGLNTDTPISDLTINGVSYTNNLVSTTSDLARLNFVGDTITDYTNENIIIRPNQIVNTALLYTPDDSNFDTFAGMGYFYATAASWEASGAKVGSSISDPKLPEHTLVTKIQGPDNAFGFDFYIIWTNFPQDSDILHNSTVTILGQEPAVHVSGIGSTGQYSIKNTGIVAENNVNFNISPTGATNLFADLYTDGNIHATGTITFDGNVTLGNEATDTITFNAEVASNIIPNADISYDLGASVPSILNWLTVYSNYLYTTNFNTDTANITTLTAGNIRLNGSNISNIVLIDDTEIIAPAYNFNSFLTVSNSTFTHLDSTTLQFVSTGNGYFKFAGDAGVVFPLGDTSQRPTSPEVGFVRYNIETATPEVYANVANTQTVTTTTNTADVNIGDTTIFVDSTANFNVGDFVSSSTVPGAFTSTTLITSITAGVSIDIDTPATAFVATGSFIDVQRKWIPVIGTSPVLSYPEVEEIMDIWTLILG